MNKADTIRCRGRPREFCVDQALAQALRVFWEKGYEGTSLNDLTEAMGITRPSLYAAFGNKESLFRKALDLYESEKLAYIGRRWSTDGAAGRRNMLRGSVDNVMSQRYEPHGCMGVITSVACGPESQSSPRGSREARRSRQEGARRSVRARQGGRRFSGARRSRRLMRVSDRNASGNLRPGQPGRHPRESSIAWSKVASLCGPAPDFIAAKRFFIGRYRIIP